MKYCKGIPLIGYRTLDPPGKKNQEVRVYKVLLFVFCQVAKQGSGKFGVIHSMMIVG